MLLLSVLMSLALAQPRPAPARPVPTASRPAPTRAPAYRAPTTRTTHVRPSVRYSPYPYGRSVVVHVNPNPWAPTWTPPARAGWVWVPGRYDALGRWIPGTWRSSRPAPSGWVYVDGYWSGSIYVDGWYRTSQRSGWQWVETTYSPDGSVLPGHWRPLQSVPPGYVWEPGLFTGDGYVDGFWRPAMRTEFRWVAARWDPSGGWVPGFWMPLGPSPGGTWEPGYFDGQRWIEGRWVQDEPARAAPIPPADASLAIPVPD